MNTTSVFEIRENEQYTTNTNTIFIQTQSLYTINYMNASDNYYFFLAIEGNESCNSLLVYNTYTLYFDKTTMILDNCYFKSEDASIQMYKSNITFLHSYFDSERPSLHFEFADTSMLYFISCTSNFDMNLSMKTNIDFKNHSSASFSPPEKINSCKYLEAFKGVKSYSEEFRNRLETSPYYEIIIIRCSFTDDKLYSQGGALFSDYLLTKITINETTFSNCVAEQGGAIYLGQTLVKNLSKLCFNSCHAMRSAVFHQHAEDIVRFSHVSADLSQEGYTRFQEVFTGRELIIDNANISHFCSMQSASLLSFDFIDLVENCIFDSNQLKALFTGGTITRNCLISNTRFYPIDTYDPIYSSFFEDCYFMNLINCNFTYSGSVFSNCYTDDLNYFKYHETGFTIFDTVERTFVEHFDCFEFPKNDPTKPPIGTGKIILIAVGVSVPVLAILIILILRYRKIAKTELAKSELSKKILVDFGEETRTLHCLFVFQLYFK